jgi:hypothetical protein
MVRRHHRLPVIWILAATWIVGIFGLGRGRMSSFQLPLVAVGGFLVYGVVAALRHFVIQARARTLPDELEDPPTCVVVRRFGEVREGVYSAVKVIDSRPPEPSRTLDLVLDDVDAEPMRVSSRRRTRRLDYIPLTGS